jgi:hypothetical protein
MVGDCFMLCLERSVPIPHLDDILRQVSFSLTI